MRSISAAATALAALSLSSAALGAQECKPDEVVQWWERRVQINAPKPGAERTAIDANRPLRKRSLGRPRTAALEGLPLGRSGAMAIRQRKIRCAHTTTRRWSFETHAASSATKALIFPSGSIRGQCCGKAKAIGRFPMSKATASLRSARARSRCSDPPGRLAPSKRRTPKDCSSCSPRAASPQRRP